jgi:hypothetical protein
MAGGHCRRGLRGNGVRKGLVRRVFLGVLAVGGLIVAMFAIAIGTRPYARPVIAQEPGGQDASFDGISQLIADAHRRGTMLHVLWTHGMCTHELNWAANRARQIAAALDGTAIQTGAIEETAGLTRVLYQINTPGGDFDAAFVVWSPMTRPFKRELDFDAPGTDRATSFPYQRATLNGAIKTKLINDCLSDAVVYGGQHGDPIRAAMKQAVCRELGGIPVDGQPCDFTGAELDRPIAVITESLGSKILFDAARAIYEEARRVAGERAAMAQRFASVQMIYLMANQIPLLDIASPLPPQFEVDAQDEDAPHASSSLGHMIGAMHRAQNAMPPDRLADMITPTVVAFTDPNDLLSYRLIPSVLDVARARLINVIGSNETTWLGLIERPDTAHCGYAWNRTVIGLIAHGHQVGKPLPEAPIVGPRRCM